MRIRIAFITAFVLIGSAFAFGQDHKLVQFQMALLKRTPKWDATGETERNQILHQHLRNVVALLQSGKAVAAGPFGDNLQVAGIFIFRAGSTDEAKTWIDADPLVKAGLVVTELHPWFSQDIFGKANMPLEMETVYFGFLKKGPNRKEGDDKTPEVVEL